MSGTYTLLMEVKYIKLALDGATHAKLKEAKGSLTWESYLLADKLEQ